MIGILKSLSINSNHSQHQPSVPSMADHHQLNELYKLKYIIPQNQHHQHQYLPENIYSIGIISINTSIISINIIKTRSIEAQEVPLDWVD